MIAHHAQLPPGHADEIRRLFSALLLMERLRPGSDDPPAADDGSSLPMDSAKPGERALPQLGDFQLIREIGPVFGVGEEDGTHFYVMQFIRGLGLDVVLQELREMRQTSQPRHGSDPLRQPLAVDDGSRVIAVAERMVAHDPADNWSHVHLFLTLCQAGQVEEAYRRVRCETVRRLVHLCHGALVCSRSENDPRDRRWIS